jgi:hypothetical protein
VTVLSLFSPDSITESQPTHTSPYPFIQKLLIIMSELIKFQLADNSKSMDDTKGNAVTLPGQGAPNGKKKGPADEVDSDDELLGDDADFVFMQEYRSKRLEGIIKCYRNALPIIVSVYPACSILCK